jgi:adenylate kinase family enzyme
MMMTSLRLSWTRELGAVLKGPLNVTPVRNKRSVHAMQRVLVIGISGAGKSTFTRRLATITGLPVIHLDTEFWKPGWKVTERAEWRAKVARLIGREAWIMDGNYGASLDLRLPRADTVVWFDYPRLVCLTRAVWRVVTSCGRVRADLARGCPEKFDLEFLRFIWDFHAKSRPQIVAMLADHGGHLAPIVFRHDREVRQFLDGVAAN